MAINRAQQPWPFSTHDVQVDFRDVLSVYYAGLVNAVECVSMLLAAHAPEHVVVDMNILISSCRAEIAQHEAGLMKGAA